MGPQELPARSSAPAPCRPQGFALDTPAHTCPGASAPAASSAGVPVPPESSRLDPSSTPQQSALVGSPRPSLRRKPPGSELSARALVTTQPAGGPRRPDQGSDARRQTHVTHSLGRRPRVRGSAGSHRFGQLRGAQENGPTAGSEHRGWGSRQALWLPGPPPDTLRPAGARAAGGSRSRARPAPRPPPAPSCCLCRLPGLPPTAPPCPDGSAFSPAPHPAVPTRAP